MDDELPSAGERLRLDDGAAPIAVVPVDGVVLPRLPGVVGPDRVPLALPLSARGVFVLATAPVLDVKGVVADGPVLPSVDEPSVDDALFVPLHGCEMPGLTVCANAAPAHAAIAALAMSRTRAFISLSFRFVSPVGEPAALRVQCAAAVTRIPRICPTSFDAGGRGYLCGSKRCNSSASRARATATFASFTCP